MQPLSPDQAIRARASTTASAVAPLYRSSAAKVATSEMAGVAAAPDRVEISANVRQLAALFGSYVSAPPGLSPQRIRDLTDRVGRASELPAPTSIGPGLQGAEPSESTAA